MKLKVPITLALLLLPALSPIPSIYGQQQQVQVPSPAGGAAMLMTATTTFTATAIGVPILNTGAGTILTGNHNIYGYTIINSSSALGDTCWLQIFDQQLASVTVGTTRARFALPILSAASTDGARLPIFTSIPLFNMTSTLVVAATATVTGSGACVGTNQLTVGHFMYR